MHKHLGTKDYSRYDTNNKNHIKYKCIFHFKHYIDTKMFKTFYLLAGVIMILISKL